MFNGVFNGVYDGGSVGRIGGESCSRSANRDSVGGGARLFGQGGGVAGVGQSGGVGVSGVFQGGESEYSEAYSWLSLEYLPPLLLCRASPEK